MSAIYEVCIFTAADRGYAEAIVDEIDPKRARISTILSREHCTEVEHGNYLKQLKRIQDRRIEDMVLVDDCREHIEENFENSLEIAAFG